MVKVVFMDIGANMPYEFSNWILSLYRQKDFVQKVCLHFACLCVIAVIRMSRYYCKEPDNREGLQASHDCHLMQSNIKNKT